ncbi:MAG: DUF6249 domain-containing protein [Opitutaceae bacterium]
MASISPVIVPIVAMLIPIAAIVCKYLARDHERERLHATVRLALEKGQPIPRELLDQAEPPENRDPRRNTMGFMIGGLVNLGVGVAVFFALGHITGARQFGWIGLIPACVGLALLGAGLINAFVYRKGQDAELRDTPVRP